MADVKKIQVKIAADTTQLDKGMAKAKSSVSKFESTIKSLGAGMLAAFSVRAVFSFGKAVLKAADIQQKAEIGLLTALDGRRVLQKELIAQAGELQKITLFGDEETIRAQSLIAAFVDEGDAIKKIIPLVQDMAAAKGMDLAGAADLVSKTLGSSTNAMSRYGIEVTGAVGSTERLTTLVDGLSNAFLGQAEAMANADLVMTQLKNRVGDIGEQIGMKLSKALVFAADVYNAKFNPAMYAADIAGRIYAETLQEVNDNTAALASVNERLGKLSVKKAQWEKAEIDRRRQYNAELALTLQLQQEQADLTDQIRIDAANQLGGLEREYAPGKTMSADEWAYLSDNNESTEGMEDAADAAEDAEAAVGGLNQSVVMAINGIVNLGSAIGAAMSGAEGAMMSLMEAIVDNIGTLMMSMGMMTGNPALFIAGAAIQLGSGIMKGLGGSKAEQSTGMINMRMRGDDLVGVVQRTNYNTNLNT